MPPSSSSSSPACSDDSEEDTEKHGELEAPGEMRPGMLVYCWLVAHGSVRATQAMVVEPGRVQTVVACPAACTLAPQGGWSEQARHGAAEQQQPGFQPGFECSCARSPLKCAVIFYTVDTRALVTAPLPEAELFAAAKGVPALPTTSSLMKAFYRSAEERSDRVQTDLGGPGAPARFDEVRLAEGSRPLLRNSIILLPDLLTERECCALIKAAEGEGAGAQGGGCGTCQDGLRRMRVCDLGLDAQELSASILLDRVLPFLEQQLPSAASGLFGRSAELRQMCFSFSPLEPAVNRYTAGGEFKVHRDLCSVTVNVLLSEQSAFAGGGTAFYQQGGEEREGAEDAVLLRPRRGTGVLFNGDVLHAGRPVETGVRHVYVASFSLEQLNQDQWSWDGSRRIRVAQQLPQEQCSSFAERPSCS